MNASKLIALAIAVTGLCCNCSSVQAEANTNKKTATITKKVANFNKIDTSNAIHIIYTQGPLAPVKITGRQNVIDNVETIVKDKTLKIRLKNKRESNINTGTIKVIVSAPMVTDFEASTASSITISGNYRTNESVELETSSAASISAGKITAGKIEIEAGSASSVTIAQLNAEKADIDISSSASVNITGKVDKAKIDASSSAKLNGKQLHITKAAKIDASSCAQVDYYSKGAVIADVSSNASATNHAR